MAFKITIKKPAAGFGITMFFWPLLQNMKKLGYMRAETDFANCAGTFSGLYEPVYQIAKSKVKYRVGVLGDWAVRTQNLSGCEHYTTFWNKRFQGFEHFNEKQGRLKAAELLAFSIRAGVIRDAAGQVTVNKSTFQKYNTADGELIEEGTLAQVVKPFWSINGAVLEKGSILKCEGVEGNA